MFGLNIGLVPVIILLNLILVAASIFRGRDNIFEKSHRNEEITLHYQPDLSLKMLLLSAVTSDQVHPQRCLSKSLPSAKFQLQTVVTRNCDCLSDRCSGYVAVSHALKVIVIAFRGTVGRQQMLLEILETLLLPAERFCGGKVQAYWKKSFETLWQDMKPKVKSLVSSNPSYKIWVTGHSLGGAMASLASVWLAYYNIAPRENIILYTFGMPRVGDYSYAQQHNQLIANSWRVVNFDDIVPRLPPLIFNGMNWETFHHGVEVFYSEVAARVNSTHRECLGKPFGEDKTCSRSQAIRSLTQSLERHKIYFGVEVGQFCEKMANSVSQGKKIRFTKDRYFNYNYD